MLYAHTALAGFAIASCLTGVSSAARAINTTAAMELPDCVVRCGAEVLPEFDCLVGEDCWCEKTGPLADRLSECVLSQCPEMRQAVEGVRFQATTCGYPMDRDLATVTGAVAYTMFALATFFLLARILSRLPHCKGAGLSWDDVIVLVCYVPVVGLTVAVGQEIRYGSGRDSWTLPADDVVAYAKWFYVAIPLYYVATFSTKLSLIALYFRVWPAGQDRRYPVFRFLCWIMAIVLIITAVTGSLVMIFACTPISNAWRYAGNGQGTCLNRVAAAYAYGSLNVAYDIIVIALPLPKLLGLDVSRRQKVGICSCFLVGFAATACSIIRLSTLEALSDAKNITWDFTPAGFWSVVEVYCSMICCCMPAMAGLINRCLSRGPFSSSRRTRLPSFEMTQPPNRGGDDTDLDTLASKSPFSSPKLPEGSDELWASPRPMRKYTIKGGLIQQVTEYNDDVR